MPSRAIRAHHRNRSLPSATFRKIRSSQTMGVEPDHAGIASLPGDVLGLRPPDGQVGLGADAVQLRSAPLRPVLRRQRRDEGGNAMTRWPAATALRIGSLRSKRARAAGVRGHGGHRRQRRQHRDDEDRANEQQHAARSRAGGGRPARPRPARWQWRRRAAPAARPPRQNQQVLRPRPSAESASGGSRPRRAARVRAAARARCAAAPSRGRPCRAAGRGRRASGTSTDTCSRRGGTTPDTRRSATASAPASLRPRSISCAPPSDRRRRRLDQQQLDSPPDRETAGGSWPPTSAARSGRCCRAARPTNRSVTGAPPLRDDEVVADAAVQHVGHRVGVGDDRDGAIRLDAIEQQPRVGALRHRSRPRRLKRETAFGEEAVARRENPRIRRLIQIQTAGIVAGSDAERLDA